jgi:actin-like ATPase involved in cell morphogenesis
MAHGERPAVGLSIGATNLAAVTADRAVTRRAVLTLYHGRPPEVGVPSENPNLAEPGLVITDFVDRVGDPAGMVAADGSTHRGEALVAEALRALAYTATGGRALPEAVAVSYPAHWAAPAVEALRGALSQVAEWSRGPWPVALAPDALAALVALQANPGLPARGIIAVCDFGGSGTSLTVVDAANGYQPVAATVRHTDFSGDRLDQAVLDHVVAELSAAGSFDAGGTAAIGSLTKLRAQCRNAKELLSSSTVTTLSADLPGYSGEIWLTRAELDELIRQPLHGFVAVVQETLQRNGIRAADVAAVALVGGGANIPALTTTLSEQLRAPVVTAPRPHLTAAIGAALRAARGPADDSQTALAPTAAAALDPFADATVLSDAVAESSGAPALAWSEADDNSAVMPIATGEYPAPQDDSAASAYPRVRAEHEERPREAARPAVPWYRREAVLITAVVLVVLAVGAVIVIALRHAAGGGAPATPLPSVSTTPAPTETSTPATESPSTQVTTVTETSTTSQPASSTESATTPSSTVSTTTAATTTTQTSTVTSTTTTTSAPAPVGPPFPRIPGIPRLPQPGPGGPPG